MKLVMRCRMEGCTGSATVAADAIRRPDTTRELHFNCDQGHRYHMNMALTTVLPCDCSVPPTPSIVAADTPA
jgi:hypothetical protein